MERTLIISAKFFAEGRGLKCSFYGVSCTTLHVDDQRKAILLTKKLRSIFSDTHNENNNKIDDCSQFLGVVSLIIDKALTNN